MTSEEDEFFARFVTETITGKSTVIKLGPNPKGGYRPRVLSTKKNAAPIQKEWPVLTNEGREFEGASLVQFGKMRFCKRCCGERIYSPLERGRRGGEGGMLGGGYGGAGGGGNGGEAWWRKWVLWMFLGEKRLKKVVWRCFCWWKWRRR